MRQIGRHRSRRNTSVSVSRVGKIPTSKGIKHGNDLSPASGRHRQSEVPKKRSEPRIQPKVGAEARSMLSTKSLAKQEIGIEAERRRHQAPFTIARRLAGFPIKYRLNRSVS